MAEAAVSSIFNLVLEKFLAVLPVCYRCVDCILGGAGAALAEQVSRLRFRRHLGGLRRSWGGLRLSRGGLNWEERKLEVLA